MHHLGTISTLNRCVEVLSGSAHASFGSDHACFATLQRGFGRHARPSRLRHRSFSLRVSSTSTSKRRLHHLVCLSLSRPSPPPCLALHVVGSCSSWMGKWLGFTSDHVYAISNVGGGADRHDAHEDGARGVFFWDVEVRAST